MSIFWQNIFLINFPHFYDVFFGLFGLIFSHFGYFWKFSHFLSNGIIWVCIWLYLEFDGSIFQENASQTCFWGCKGLWCTFTNFQGGIRKIGSKSKLWHFNLLDGPLDQREIFILKKWPKINDLTSKGHRGPPLSWPTPETLLKKIFVQNLQNIKPLAQSQIAHMAKNGSEVEQFFALFDPLCPDASAPGPMCLVTRSTFGVLPNDTPTSLVRLPIAVLCPKNENPLKQGSKY